VEERLDEVESRAVELGVVSPTGLGGKAGRPEAAVPYRRYVIDGFEVYIGKTDKQNDELTTSFAKPWDIWLHVSAHSGSHVVIRRQKNTDWPPHTVVEKAAALAVWFSKARHTSYAEVHATEARFVRKPRKFAPGKVIAERGKTVRVSPLSPKALFGGAEEGLG
jgi:predicted ribosome quality control (RQC) complex YloA/Tae2 family protein